MASTASCVPFQSGRPLQTTSINAPGIMDGHVDVHGGECNVAADASRPFSMFPLSTDRCCQGEEGGNGSARHGVPKRVQPPEGLQEFPLVRSLCLSYVAIVHAVRPVSTSSTLAVVPSPKDGPVPCLGPGVADVPQIRHWSAPVSMAASVWRGLMVCLGTTTRIKHNK